jgi:hypothetical protein
LEVRVLKNLNELKCQFLLNNKILVKQSGILENLLSEEECVLRRKMTTLSFGSNRFINP